MIERVGENILLVGTAHVSPESAAEVRGAIQEFRPDVVAVELCERRYRVLKDKEAWESLPMTRLLKDRNAYAFIAQSFLSAYQRRLGERLGAEPGAEMLEAIRAAEERGVKVVLADRDITITLKRAWKRMGLREKWRVVRTLFQLPFVEYEEGELDLKELMKEDALTAMMRELRELAPTVAEVLIEERDIYIARRIVEAASGGGKVLAVVGAGHLQGVKARIAEALGGGPGGESGSGEMGGTAGPLRAGVGGGGEAARAPGTRVRGVGAGGATEAGRGGSGLARGRGALPSIAELEALPPPGFPWGRALGWGITILLCGILVWMALTRGVGMALEAFGWWFLIHALLSAGFCAVARGHPLSIGTAFIASPFTAIHPGVAAGWFSGLVEAKVRTPTVKDWQELGRVATTKEFFNNRVIRVLMVAALTNVGSMIGTFVAMPYLIRMGLG
ncbi:MAG: TraB/GumN family protein [Thermoplasmata archaeon]